MAVGQSDDVDPNTAIDEAIRQCRDQLAGARPRVGILFAAFDSFDPSLISRVREAFPGVDIMGSTSSAEMSSVAGYQEDSVALAVFASDNVEMSVGMGAGLDHDAEAAARAAMHQALGGITQEPKICIVLTESVNGQRAIEALRDHLPKDVLLIGGASGRQELAGGQPTFQFCNEQVSESSVAILVLAGPVAYSTSVGTGWRVLGPRGMVTRAGYGVIHEIDDRPAVEWASSYLDMTASGTLGNPLAIQEPGSDDWYLRVALAADENGGLLIPGAVPVGATVQLTTTDPDEMLQATSDAVERARLAFPDTASPQAALFFSCAVRKYLLGTRAAQEIAAAQTLLPQALPMAGMYCIGEIAPTGSAAGSHFLNETFVTLLLGS